jgi:2,5-furandicarboxylate decarboxylase 1
VRANTDTDNQSLRGFLRMVETDYPDELLRVREPIDLRFDSTALVFELDRAGKSPVVVRGKGMKLVTNVAGSRELLAACLGVETGDLPTAFRERCQKYILCATS